MCSSYTTKSKTEKAAYEKNYGKPWLEADLVIAEKYHEADGDAIAFPGAAMPVITLANPEYIQAYFFGFIPHWISADKVKEKRATFNARIETIPDLATWRDAWKNDQRCVVCTNGFFEFNKQEKRKMSIHLKDDACFFYAGIYSDYVNKQTGEIIRTMAVVTTEANSLVGEIHNRMPVIIPIGNEGLWLEKSADLNQLLKQYGEPFNANLMVMEYADEAPNKPIQGSLF